ncbi:MAG: hypothetical protein AMJ84_04830 [Acidithiobacillales bacterium SM23_46]|nr:MAG: hypothetical protein AMJ84_04830 [Acidithiobacillales bacterium SM23_46]
MAVDPTGILGLPLTAGANLFANSSTFQTLVGAESAEEAMTYISLGGLEAAETGVEGDGHVIIAHAAFEPVKIGEGGRNLYQIVGALRCELLAPIPQDYLETVQDAYVWFCNIFGAVLAEVIAQLGTNDALGGGSEITIEAFPTRIDPDDVEELGTKYHAIIIVPYLGGAVA